MAGPQKSSILSLYRPENHGSGGVLNHLPKAQDEVMEKFSSKFRFCWSSISHLFFFKKLKFTDWPCGRRNQFGCHLEALVSLEVDRFGSFFREFYALGDDLSVWR